ncbi:MAG: hypothetical protein IPJ90_11415 [Anaerolineaceae bacterium]|nr:hypothetical protein [Anaerolineaceae bacterium]
MTQKAPKTPAVRAYGAMQKLNNNTSLSLIPVPLMMIQKLTLKQRHVYEYRVKAGGNERERPLRVRI